MARVAVCIPSYNDERYLPFLLESLRTQTYKDFRVYASYDGSTDKTGRVWTAYSYMLPIVVAPFERRPGIGWNKNKVVRLALRDTPDYIQMIDADDIVAPEFLEAVVGRMDEGDVDWCICWGRLFGDREGYIHSQIEPLEQLLTLNRRHAWGTFGSWVLREQSYDPTIMYAEDWDLWIRLDSLGYEGDVVKQELYFKRWHNSSLMATRGNEGYREAFARNLERYADRLGFNTVLKAPLSDEALRDV